MQVLNLLIAFVLSASALKPMPTPRGNFENFSVNVPGRPPATVRGWVLPAGLAKPKGTIFTTHGFDADRRMFLYWQWVREQLGWDMVMFDLREHGASSSSPWRFTTLGDVEARDVRAVIDFADKRGLAKPYVIFSSSLGAATQLREAADDPRVRGAYVHAPFPNAWYGLSHFRWRGYSVGPIAARVLPPFVRRRFERVDVVDAMHRRNDFRLWITVGDIDWFGPDQQRRILDSLQSPAGMKKLFVRPNSVHGDWWSWQPHEATLRAFLKASEGD